MSSYTLASIFTTTQKALEGIAFRDRRLEQGVRVVIEFENTSEIMIMYHQFMSRKVISWIATMLYGRTCAQTNVDSDKDFTTMMSTMQAIGDTDLDKTYNTRKCSKLSIYGFRDTDETKSDGYDDANCITTVQHAFS